MYAFPPSNFVAAGFQLTFAVPFNPVPATDAVAAGTAPFVGAVTFTSALSTFAFAILQLMLLSTTVLSVHS